MNNWVLPVLVLASFLTLLANTVHADADGPDYFSVINVASDDILNMRTGPAASYPKTGELRHDADGIANLGCIGGMALAEWLDASEKEREADLFKEWCLVGHDRLVGWSSGRYLTEGTHLDGFRAGQVLPDLQGSEWRATRIGTRPVDRELIVRFESDGRFGGSSGCNRMMGSYVRDRDEVSIGPIATTRKLCADDVMEAEAQFVSLLKRAELVSAHHLVLVLLATDSEILAQFARTDWD